MSRVSQFGRKPVAPSNQKTVWFDEDINPRDSKVSRVSGLLSYKSDQTGFTSRFRKAATNGNTS